MMKSNSLSLRKINIGIICALIIFAFNIFNGMYKVFGIESIDSYEISNIINITALYFFYISIWMIIRDIFIYKYEQFQLRTFLTWMIRLIAIMGALTVLYLIIKTPAIGALILIIGLSGLVILIIFMNKIMKIKKEDVIIIKHMKNYIISLIIIFLLFITLKIIELILIWKTEFEFIELSFVNDFLGAIPIIFIILFFLDERKEIIKSRNID